jgi:hypothetical protein
MSQHQQLIHGDLRPPDWRWRTSWNNDQSRYHRCPDAYVAAARRFRNGWNACRTNSEEELLAARMPILYQAHGLYVDRRDGARQALEARVLAAQDEAAIAQALGIHPSVVTFYECVFFDVRDRLGNRDYILRVVLSPTSFGDASDGPLQYAWKLLGYLGGPAVLEVLMDATAPSPRPTGAAQIREFLDRFADDTLRKRLAVASSRLDATDRAIREALLWLASRENSRRTDDSKLNEWETIAKAILKQIPWSFGERGLESQPPQREAFSRSAVEPRAKDLLRLWAGEEIPELQERLNVKLPPPRSSRENPTGGELLP